MKLGFIASGVLSCILASNLSFAGDDWLNREVPFAAGKILAHISPEGSRPGVVIASPQKKDPDYYFHWVRDGALVMDALGRLHASHSDVRARLALKQRLLDYADFSRLNQLVPTLTGLGEPKFHVDGASYIGPWARPQNDGPALRAIALIQFAEQLLDEGETKYVRSFLYDGNLPTGSVIKTDLEYVSHHWRDSSFDLWEETKGDHFYTRMVQRKSMLRGAALATRLGDPGAAAWYLEQARLLQIEIEKHWDSARGFFVATLNRTGGVDYKNSNIDSAVILGLLHGDNGDGFLSFKDYRVQSTLKVIEETFKKLYPINWRAETPGIAIGRYPEDRYAGADFNGGNPWVLTTLAFAEAYFKSAREFERSSDISKADELRHKAQFFIDRVAKHAYPEGGLSEQIQRQTGEMTSAADLTWNYAAVLTTTWARGN